MAKIQKGMLAGINKKITETNASGGSGGANATLELLKEKQ